jgi:hypothetical protein
MPLCFSYNLQGLGVPVGTPKPFFLNMLLCLKQSGGPLQDWVLEGWKLNVSKLTKTGNYGRVTFTMARVNSGRPKKSCSVLRSNPKKISNKNPNLSFQLARSMPPKKNNGSSSKLVWAASSGH